MPNSKTWVLVADSSQAKIFQISKFPKIEEIEVLEHPESRLHNQDLVTSKPGRSFQAGGTTRHAYETHVSPKEEEAIKFAIHVREHLSKALQDGKYHRLYLFASPAFLGLLRQHIDNSVQKVIVGELSKDLTSSSLDDIEQHISNL